MVGIFNKLDTGKVPVPQFIIRKERHGQDARGTQGETRARRPCHKKNFMAEKQIESKILNYLKASGGRQLRPRKLARELDVQEEEYHAFRTALRDLMREGRVVLGGGGSVVLPTQKQGSGLIVGVYRNNRKGFGFVEPRDPTGHEDLYIPAGENGGAINGDIVSAKITNQRRGAEGKTLYEGRVMEILERTQKRFVGTLVKQHNQWLVIPDGKS